VAADKGAAKGRRKVRDIQFWLFVAALVTLQIEIILLRSEVSELKRSEKVRASWEAYKAQNSAS
jgi:hypothetical protein